MVESRWDDRPLSAREWWAWAVTGLVLLVGSSVYALRDEVHTYPAYAVSAAVVGASLVATGLYMAAGGRGRWTGIAAVFTGSLWPLDWAAVGEASAGPLVAWLVGGARWIALAYVAVTYPADLPRDRGVRNVIAAAALLFGPGNVVLVLVSRPEWNGFAAHAWWPGPFASRPLYSGLSALYGAGCVAIAVVCGMLVVRRLRAAAGVDRLVIRASLFGMVVAGLVAASAKAYQSLRLTEDAWRQHALVTGLGMLAVPASLLVSNVRLRIAKAGVVGTITRLSRPATVENVRLALATALHDETIEVQLGRPGTGPRSTGEPPGRVTVPVTDANGRPLAVITADPRLQNYSELVQAAVAAARLPLENAQMNADLRAALRETERSRARIYEAQVTERRRLERNLHDGVQQRILGMALQLELLRTRTREPDTEHLALEVKRELHVTLDEIRVLARGLNPAALQQGGLAAALTAAAAALPLDVTIDVRVPALSPAEETAVYFVVCEALANSTKHAEADHAQVDVRAGAEDVVEVSVTDDGRGGAAISSGGGIQGMADRIGALGGTLVLDSPPGGGTSVRMTFRSTVSGQS